MEAVPKEVPLTQGGQIGIGFLQICETIEVCASFPLTAHFALPILCHASLFPMFLPLTQPVLTESFLPDATPDSVFYSFVFYPHSDLTLASPCPQLSATSPVYGFIGACPLLSDSWLI